MPSTATVYRILVKFCAKGSGLHKKKTRFRYKLKELHEIGAPFRSDYVLWQFSVESQEV